jgi:integrase
VGTGSKRGPSASVRIGAKRQRSPLALSSEQVKLGLAQLEFRDQLLVFLEGALGIRQGELGALRWLLCDFDNTCHGFFSRRNENGNLLHHFTRKQDRVGIVWEIDIESGMHLHVRVICCGILDNGYFVSKLGRKSHRGFDARVGYEPDLPCFLSCRSRSVLANPLEHQCSCVTISPV